MCSSLGQVVKIDPNQEMFNRINAAVYVDLARRHASGEFKHITMRNHTLPEECTRSAL